MVKKNVHYMSQTCTPISRIHLSVKYKVPAPLAIVDLQPAKAKFPKTAKSDPAAASTETDVSLTSLSSCCMSPCWLSCLDKLLNI